MDKQQITGILLIFAIILSYSIFIAPSAEEKAEMKRIQDSTRQANLENHQRMEAEKARRDSIAKFGLDSTSQALVNDSVPLADSIRQANLKAQYGIFASAISGTEQEVTLENNLIKVNFSTKGAYPIVSELKTFKTFQDSTLYLFDKGDNTFDLNFYSDNRPIQTRNLFFELAGSGETHVVAENDEKSVTFRLKASENQYIEFIYSLEPNSYELKYNVNFVGMTEHIPRNTYEIDILWDAKSRRQEKGAKWENQNTTVYFKYKDDAVSRLTPTSDEDEEILESKVRWLAYKDHFFASTLIAHEYFTSGKTAFIADPKEEKYLKYYKSQLRLPYDALKDNHYAFTWYMGPIDYDILSKVKTKEDDNLELRRMLPLGWALFRWVNQFVIIPLFNLLGSFIGNMGIIILLMTLIIKGALFPLTYKSYQSSAKMRVLKPQIDEINAKIPKEKAMERQQATMALYRKAGVNPLGGCLPMLFQFPILISLYLFFPASIELRQQSFLWAEDLSTYDSILDLPFNIPMYGDHVSLFTLLMAAAMFVSTWMNRAQMQGSNQQMPGMKLMLYMMPVMMLLWFNNYSAGLSYYYFLSNVITIIQIWAARKLIDEDKILAKIELNKKKSKPKKKSKFQDRLEKMAKEQKKQANMKKRK